MVRQEEHRDYLGTIVIVSIFVRGKEEHRHLVLGAQQLWGSQPSKTGKREVFPEAQRYGGAQDLQGVVKGR